MSRDYSGSEIIKDTIEAVVVDWMNKYPLDGSLSTSDDLRLSVKGPEDIEGMKFWAQGVWGRITHEVLNSGLPYDNNEILKIALNVFYAELSRHPWFEQLKPFLPKKSK